MPARRNLTDQAVEARARRHDLARVDAVLGREDVRDLAPQPRHRAGRAVRLVRDRLLDRGDHPLVHAARELTGEPPIDQPDHTIALIAAAHPPHRGQRHRLTRGLQLGNLGRLPLPQAAAQRVVPGRRLRARRAVRPQPGQQLNDMRLPPLRARHHLRGQPFQHAARRQREAGVREQFDNPDRDKLAGHAPQRDSAVADRRDREQRAAPADLVARGQTCRPRHRHADRPRVSTVAADSGSDSRSASITRRHSK